VKDIKLYIVTFFFLFHGIALSGQIRNLNELGPWQLKRFARNAVRAGDVQSAIFFYEKYREIKPYDDKINYALANLHNQARNYLEARDLYLLVIERAEHKYPLARFYYARMLKSIGDYENAIVHFTLFRKDYKGKGDSRTYRRLARYEINGCDSAMIIIQNPMNVTIQSLNSSINSPHIELSPIPIDDDHFIYASLRVDSLVYFTDENADTAMPVRQFYKARKEGMDWMGGELLATFNIPGVETGNGVFSRDEKRFYFTRCQKNWQGKVICSIYRSTLDSSGWNRPEKLPSVINDPNYTTTQPALARTAKSDREIIYFVSDRPEGKGGLDIWYTVWNHEKDLYSKPRTLGSRINTAGDEMTPFYNYSNRTLYFSSAGLPGIGGLDVFKAFGERRKWKGVQNIGYPLNSSYDDLYYTVSRKEEDGFFVSNRPDSLDNKTCCDDIFYYRWNDFIRITVTGIIYPFETDRFGRKKDLTGFDFMNPGEDIEPLNNAKVALYMKDDEENDYVFVDRYSTGEDGRYYFTLAPDNEYEFRMEGFQYFDSKNYFSTEFFNFSDTIEMPPTWVNVYSEKPIVLENIYYEFNSAELTEDSKNVLDTTLLILLKEAPEFIVEIGSHTDSIGDYQYNMELSEQRAENVVEYLITKGINTDRLVARGYGAQQPVAPNFNPDGSDNEEGRERNRRTEFRVIGTIGDEDEDEVYVAP
jgi:outer membrane protein OmpA-like peptidoglycan-associated protein/tetratricopeptide (TPR) repeat protein